MQLLVLAIPTTLVTVCFEKVMYPFDASIMIREHQISLHIEICELKPLFRFVVMLERSTVVRAIRSMVDGLVYSQHQRWVLNAG